MQNTSSPGSPSGDHALVRERARAVRKELTGVRRQAAEQSITHELLGLHEFSGESLDVGWFLATDGEVDLSSAVGNLRARGHTLWLPVVGDRRSLTFRCWTADTPLGVNRYGIREPLESSDPQSEQRRACDLDVVIVPSVAFDRDCNRIGFGAGYYDRALADATKTATVGVGFGVQLVDRIEPKEWDVPLGVVVTDIGVFRCRPRRSLQGGPQALPGGPQGHRNSPPDRRVDSE